MNKENEMKDGWFLPYIHVHNHSIHLIYLTYMYYIIKKQTKTWEKFGWLLRESLMHDWSRPLLWYIYSQWAPFMKISWSATKLDTVCLSTLNQLGTTVHAFNGTVAKCKSIPY